MKKIVTTGMILSLILAAHTCRQIRKGVESIGERQPLIEVAPLEQGGGQWKIAATGAVTIAVTAPGAERIQILGRPVGVKEDYLELRTLTTPVDRARGRFVTRLNLASDFGGQVWAEATYPDGAKKRAETVALAVDTAGAGTAARPEAVGGSVGTDESARSDKLTGGRIRRTRLIAGEPDIRITVNAPAFQLTLWQNGKEVSAYHIGIGQKNFPVPVGERGATAIIFNPSWAAPDSAWASHGNSVSPDEGIRPNDPRPRLSKVKIPLGSGYMIHEAAKADDIGHAVSQGCILMLRDDLLDLAEKILMARDPSVAKSRITQLMGGYERFVAPLDPPLLVDINYDLYVVEGGVLHVYPDVYERGAFALDGLRAELQSAGVAATLLGDQSLQWILDQVGVDTKFVIKVADIRKGRPRRGRKLPLIDKPIENKREIAAGSRRWEPDHPSKPAP
jgi:lipoprotein-anchoring transpeptidase ErfK/SrfK